MVRPGLGVGREGGVLKDKIHREWTFGKVGRLGRDGGTLDGLNVQGAIVEEVHAHPNGDMGDVLQTATGARRHRLL